MKPGPEGGAMVQHHCSYPGGRPERITTISTAEENT
jgi:hypothetical protein